MKLTAKNSRLLTLVILIIFDGFIIFAAVLIARDISAQKSAISEEIAKLDKRHLSAQNLRANLAQVKEIGGRVMDYEKHFFSGGNELRLITDLEAIAAKNTIDQRIVTSNLDNYSNNRIDIEISATGDYLNLLKYMNDMENYKYFLIIEGLDFQPTGRAAEQNTASLHLDISLYAQPVAENK